VTAPMDIFDVAENGAVDLIILDYHFKNVDGFYIMEKLSCAGACREIPVLIISEEKDFLLLLDAIERGAKDIIHYPLNEDRFLEKIEHILGKNMEHAGSGR